MVKHALITVQAFNFFSNLLKIFDGPILRKLSGWQYSVKTWLTSGQSTSFKWQMHIVKPLGVLDFPLTYESMETWAVKLGLVDYTTDLTQTWNSVHISHKTWTKYRSLSLSSTCTISYLKRGSYQADSDLMRLMSEIRRATVLNGCVECSDMAEKN